MPVEDVAGVRRKYQIGPFPELKLLLGRKVLVHVPASSYVRQHFRVPHGKRCRIGKGSDIEIPLRRVAWIVVPTAIGGSYRNIKDAVGLNRSEPTWDYLVGRYHYWIACEVRMYTGHAPATH